MLFKYVLEIKTRIFLVAISWLLTAMACYCHKETLLFLLIKSNTKLYCMASFYFITTNLTEVFTVYLRLSYFVSTQFTFFVLLYHCLMFFAPALFRTEYNIIKQPVFISLGFLFLSILIFNILLLPLIWSFFLSFIKDSNNSINIIFEAKIIEYYEFFTSTYFIVVFIGQLFGFVLFMLNVVKDKHKFVKVTRKVFYVFFFVTSYNYNTSRRIQSISYCFMFCFVIRMFYTFSFFKIKIFCYKF